MTTPPLTDADSDLREFAFMPLDVVRLRDSDLTARSTGDEFRCAVLLWCASWHQVPAGSLPDDDIVLAQLAGFGRIVKEWQKCRDGALRGWVKCLDGRLYHPVVAEKVNEAWAGRVKYAERKEAERARKAEERRLKKLAEDARQQVLNQQMSEGQNGIVQRTSSGSPAENALKETVDSGQWTVDSGQLTSTAHVPDDATDIDCDPRPGVAPLPMRERPPVSDDPAIQIAVALRRLGVHVNAAHPTVIEWAKKGVSPDMLAEAVATARMSKPTGNIPGNYLAPIVAEMLNPPSARQGAGQRYPPRETLAEINARNNAEAMRLLDGKPPTTDFDELRTIDG